MTTTAGRLPIRDVSAILGVTRQRVHQMIRLTGVIPRRFGPILALTPEDIARLQEYRAHGAPLGRPKKTLDAQKPPA
jgi:hypothetical protein